MTARAPLRLPKLCCHKATNRGYVRLDGKFHYLGDFDDPATHAAAHQLIAEWIANGYRLRVAPEEVTVVEVLDAYFEHCKVYYRRPDGSTHTGSLDSVRLAIEDVLRVYGKSRAIDFGPLALRAIIRGWINAGLRRTTINKRMGDVKRAFKWAVSMEMVPPSVHQGLMTVEGLRRGRSEAKESRKVTAVPEAHVEAIRPYVSRQVWGLIQVQLLTGARSGEVLYLRRIDIDTSGKVWTARIEHHKTSHEGKERTLYFGSRAQAVLREFFVGKGPMDYLFSPKDAERERREQAHQQRKTPLSCGNRPGTNKKRRPSVTPGDHYTADSYRRAVERGCKLADVPVWHPHQLRHACATKLRKEFGLDAAAVFLGHSKCDVTQVYAQLNADQAIEVARKVG